MDATRRVRPDFQRVKAKAFVYEQGEAGPMWRIAEGVIALEAQDVGGRKLAGLALQGDLIGAEQLLDGRYAWSARAMLPCQLVSWREGDAAPNGDNALIRGLVSAQRRAADLLALRVGAAQDRVVRLIRMLDPSAAEEGILLPTLRDMSLITTISPESICRELARLRAEGRLRTANGRHHLLKPCALPSRPMAPSMAAA